MERGLYEATLEYRQRGRHLSGSFPYGSTATIADRGRRRKERFNPGAFRFAVESNDHDIDLLLGHSFDQPLGSKRAGNVVFTDTAAALRFEAELPPESQWPTWMRDAVLAVRGGLARGVSPGFVIPPSSAVQNAVREIPEPGNPGVTIREINEAVLYELSIVTRPAYPDTRIEARSGADPEAALRWL